MSASLTTEAEHRRTSWWATRALPPATGELAGDFAADVAVIGAGFTGLTAAWRMARRGMRVIVLEGDELGAGASGVNAGFVVPNFARSDPAAVMARLGFDAGKRLLSAAGAGADVVFNTIRENAIDCDAEQTGWMHVAHSKRMLETLRGRALAWQALGRPVRMLDEEEARARSAARHCVGALLDESGGMLHPLNYLYGLARLALAAGVEIMQRAPVEAAESEGDGWRLRIGAHNVSAKKILLCTNASRGGLARLLFRAIVPLRVHQVATRPLGEAEARRISPRRNPIADTRADLFTCRLDRDNRLITGGVAILPFGAHRRMAKALARRLQTELSLAEAPEIEHVWRGVAAMTTDFLPHLYEFAPGFIGGIGCNGRGVALTAVLGETLADAAAGERLANLPIPLAPARSIPFHFLARAAPSFAIAEARWRDRLAH